MAGQVRLPPDPNATPAQGISRTRLISRHDELPKPPRIRQPWAPKGEIQRWAAAGSERLRRASGLPLSPDQIMVILASLALVGCMLSGILFVRLASCRMVESQTGEAVTLVQCFVVGP